EAVPGIEPQPDAITAALGKELYATDEAFRLVREEGLTFRDAYVRVGRDLDAVPMPDQLAVLHTRTHAGSTGALGLDTLAETLDRCTALWVERRRNLHAIWSALLTG
ncbi:MAG: argininosuccinate lyase, partial [Planctomycetota bacterium]